MQDQAISWRNYSTNVRNVGWQKHLLRWGLATGWHLAPARTALAIKNRFFAPNCQPLTPEGESWLKRGRPFRIHVGGAAIQGWEWGYGPGVLFVHGWNGRAAHFAPFFGPLLEAGCSVIAFDAPGHGLSNGRTSSYFQFIDAVRTLMRKGSGRRMLGLVGHSLGGAAVIAALSREKMESQTVLISPALDLQNILFTAFAGIGIPARIYRAVIAGFEQQFGYSLEKDNPIRLLPVLDKPVLLVHDRRDRTISYIESRRAAEQNDNVVLHTTDGLGHMRILADPSVVRQVVSHLTGSFTGSTIEDRCALTN
jgi:pimeloyl-ACP methyl ester carboxylesterase